MPPHDRLFKTILRAFFADLLRLVAPAVAKQALLAEITFLVLSIVLYLQGGEPGICWQELDREVKAPEVTRFRYITFGLAGCRAEDYLERPEPLAWALAAVMEPGPLSRTELRLACLHQIGKARLPMERRGLLEDFVDAYLHLTVEEEREYKMLGGGKPQEAKVMFMTLSERTRAEGFREEERETLRKVLLRQLHRRFGPLPETVKQQIEEMTSIPRLNGLLERVLTASSLRELRLLR